MRKLFISTGFLLTIFGLLGCNFAYSIVATPTPTEELLATPEVLTTQNGEGSPQLTGDWHISMAQTGGIAGVSRTLEISSDGKMTVTDERTKKQVISQLSADQMTKLIKLIASTHYQPSKQPTGCADCFIYNLQINSDTEKFQAQTDDVNLPDSGLEPLVRFLGELLNHR